MSLLFYATGTPLWPDVNGVDVGIAAIVVALLWGGMRLQERWAQHRATP